MLNKHQISKLISCAIINVINEPFVYGPYYDMDEYNELILINDGGGLLHTDIIKYKSNQHCKKYNINNNYVINGKNICILDKIFSDFNFAEEICNKLHKIIINDELIYYDNSDNFHVLKSLFMINLFTNNKKKLDKHKGLNKNLYKYIKGRRVNIKYKGEINYNKTYNNLLNYINICKQNNIKIILDIDNTEFIYNKKQPKKTISIKDVNFNEIINQAYINLKI